MTPANDSAPQGSAGFTLIEVMVAVVLLTVGLLALAGATANVTRMVGQGQFATEASQMATMRFERMRQIAASTTPACGATAFQSGGPMTSHGMTERWTVTGTGATRRVTVTVTYPGLRGRMRTDSLSTLVRCQ